MKGITLLCILAAATVLYADPRTWDTLDVPVRQGAYLHWAQQTARQTDGSTLLVWDDMRSGDYDIYGQLISAAGDTLWAAGGIPLCRHPAPQIQPVVTAITGGNWIVAWLDLRNSPFCGGSADDPCGNLYAQKVSPSGQLLWPDNDGTGVAVDVSPSRIQLESLQIVPDAAGGAYFAWQDSRVPGLYSSVIARRITSTGHPAPGWEDAVRIGISTDLQVQLQTIPDGQGNLLAAWTGYDAHGDLGVFAGKLTANGARAWGDSGITVAGFSGIQEFPKLCTDGSGGYFITWSDADLRMQHCSANGALLWDPAGVTICNAAGGQYPEGIVPGLQNGSQDGCLIVWGDGRSGSYSYALYAQKVTSQGLIGWAENGIPVCSEPVNGTFYADAVIADSAGGLICSFEVPTADTVNSNADLVAARINSAGNLVWSGDCGTLVLPRAGSEARSTLMLVGGRCRIITGYQQAMLMDELRYQDIDLADGHTLLEPPGRSICYGEPDVSTSVHAVPLNNHRTAVVWEDLRHVGRSIALYYQIFDALGHTQLLHNGAVLLDPVTNREQNTADPQVSPDGNGGFFAVCDMYGQPPFDMRFAHVNAQGVVLTPLGGTIIYPLLADTGAQSTPICAPDGQGGAFVAWQYSSNTGMQGINLERLSATGDRLWTNPTQLARQTDDIWPQAVLSTGGGNCTVVWMGGRNADRYALSAGGVGAGGSLQWQIVIRIGSVASVPAPAVADGLGGLFVIWVDTAQPQVCVLAQHVDAAGTHWPQPVQLGEPVVTVSTLAAVANSNHDLYAVWSGGSSESNTDVFAQRVSLSGALQWDSDGITLCSAPHSQTKPQAVVDGTDNLFVVWEDARDSLSRTFGTYVDLAGNVLPDPWWVPLRGGPVSRADRAAQAPAVAWDGSGFVVAWEESNPQGPYPPNGDVYAQHIADANFDAAHAAPRTPDRFALSQNYPNPFNPTTQISFALPKSGMTTLKVYDLLGRHVTTLVNGVMPAGNHTASFDAAKLASGLYLYRLESGSFSSTRKTILLK